ncbi:MAG TPA: spore germination protein [Ruminococcaceae bacterium]|nr:spore germination protein [Oscillospiraceae bacterium]
MLEFKFTRCPKNLIETAASQITLSNCVETTNDIDTILQAILYGDCVLLASNCSNVLVLNSKGWITRSIVEPESERVLKGPREGFNEAIMLNLTMLRRRLMTPDFKIKFMTFGTRSKTKACICYLDSIVNKSVLQELEKRLQKISIDGIIDSNYIAELIKDSPYSPVKTVGNTERPDVVAAKLLEGRIAFLLDGSPVALTVPHLFIELFQSDEDYYINFLYSSFGRLLRIISFLLTTSIPAVYLSLITFHHEMLPTPLIMSISTSRQGVPFPTVIELLMMLIIFDLLREAGARMPGMMGQALSIVGALVIGQAAVEAKIVSAPIIIMVALIGITGLMVPRSKGFSIYLRFFLVLLSTMIGIYGFLFGYMIALIHLFGISSFGIPIMTGSYSDNMQDAKDIYIRAPWWKMIKRPKLLSPNETRQAASGGKK